MAELDISQYNQESVTTAAVRPEITRKLSLAAICLALAGMGFSLGTVAPRIVEQPPVIQVFVPFDEESPTTPRQDNICPAPERSELARGAIVYQQQGRYLDQLSASMLAKGLVGGSGLSGGIEVESFSE